MEGFAKVEIVWDATAWRSELAIECELDAVKYNIGGYLDVAMLHEELEVGHVPVFEQPEQFMELFVALSVDDPCAIRSL